MVDRQEKLALLQEQYDRLVEMDFRNEMTDNFYYTSGRKDRMKKQIEAIAKSIRMVQKDIERNP